MLESGPRALSSPAWATAGISSSACSRTPCAALLDAWDAGHDSISSCSSLGSASRGSERERETERDRGERERERDRERERAAASLLEGGGMLQVT